MIINVTIFFTYLCTTYIEYLKEKKILSQTGFELTNISVKHIARFIHLATLTNWNLRQKNYVVYMAVKTLKIPNVQLPL